MGIKMQRTFQYLISPVFANQQGTAINVTVKFAELPMEVPFTATPHDEFEHGRDLYARLMAGEFGVISAYVPPTESVIASDVRCMRNELLKESDYIEYPSFRADKDPEFLTAWDNYRTSLRNVTTQAGFPYQIQWPVPPT